MFRRLMKVLSRNRKSKTNAENVKIEYATIDMGNNVHSSTHAILNTTANDASGVYETINSTVHDHRYSPAVNVRCNSADSPSLSVLCDGSKSLISDAFWSGMLEIQRNFQEAAQYYENSPAFIVNRDDTLSCVTSVGMNNYSSLSGENTEDTKDSEFTMLSVVSLPNDINTSDVSITDDGLEHSDFVSLAYMVTLNLLQVEKEFAHHLAALQKFRNILSRRISKEQETMIFQNMNELGVISEVCADELRVILNASQRPNLDRSNDTAAEVQLTVEDIYDACFPVFREELDAYIQGLDRALALCKELHRSTSFFSDVMTEEQFDLLMYLLASPTYHPMNIVTALQEVLKTMTQPRTMDACEIDDKNSICLSSIDEDDMIVSFNSTFMEQDAENNYIAPADDFNKFLAPINPDNRYLSSLYPDNKYHSPVIPYSTYPGKVISINMCISPMDEHNTYPPTVDKEDTTYLSPVDQNNICFSPSDSHNIRISPVGQDHSFMSYIDPELITRRQFLSHYQQQGMSTKMSAVLSDKVDKLSKFKRGNFMTASRRDYVRNRFRSTNVFITLVEDM